MMKRKIVTVLTALALTVPSLPGTTHAAGEAVQVWLTNPNNNTWLARQSDVNFASSSSGADYTINVNNGTTYQSMDGFGASLTDSSAWLLANKLSASKRTEVMNSLFGPSGINISALRQPIGASDFNWESWTYDDTTNNVDDMNLNSFSLWREDAYIRPMLDQAYNVNKGRIKLFAAPWSPPAWMKTNKGLNGNTGGTLRTDAYQAYANYLVKYLQQYSAKGTPIYAMSVQNEPKFNPNWPGMVMSANEQINFINVLGPKLSQNGLNTKIMAYDHNYDDINYASTVLNSSASNYVSGSAFHYYSNLSHSNLTALHNQYPSKDIWFTEGGSGTWIGGGTNKGMFQDLIMHTIRFPRNWAKSYIMWNIALDQNGGPALAGIDGTNRGLITIRSDSTDNVSYNPQYYGLGHSSKFVDQGAARIDTNTFQDSMEDVAYKNPDGSIALILSNRQASAKSVKIQWGSQSFTYQVPAEGAITFKWSGSGSTGTGPIDTGVTPAVGGTYRITAKSSSKALDVSNVSIADGAAVQQWDYTGGSNQKWVLRDAGNGYYNLISQNSGKGLDVESNSTADGAKVQQWTVSGSGGNNQQWQLVSAGNGYYKIINRNSGKALQVSNNSTANGAAVVQWASGAGDNQLFTFQTP
ncbi:RICIN domain-containing protein [Paenibacillus sp. MMS18-CY102]|uniref:RICIN domain-containing protein n=1 Tax=Paenibacillus sp. MMS18-CY102 TaxID=2682849 RepID=UPI00136640ED|nr:RICIN domain-containing protein [Paenibacillus sp. MMS18-CY102]MWC30354.1 glucan endo-1,6-beta-glucosidase [Paenibacillus sp. MMS18-CY102]